jgi:hypothetical protein
MRLAVHTHTADQDVYLERSAVARLMASGKLGERLAAAARAATAIHLAESARTSTGAPSHVVERPA